MIGLLTHLSTALGRSEAESAALLNAFVREAQALTRTQGEAAYPGLGTFRMGTNGTVEFRPDASLALVVNHRFAGLTPVPVQPSPQHENAFAPSWGTASPGASPQTGWMTPPAPLETVGATHLPGDGRFAQAPPADYTAPPADFAAPPQGYAAPAQVYVPPAPPYAAPAPGASAMPPPGEIPPLGAYGAAGAEPYTAPRFAAAPSPEAAAYVPPQSPYAAPTDVPYTAPTYAAPTMRPPGADPTGYTEAAFAEASPFGPPTGPPAEPAPRATSSSRNVLPWGTLVLLAALGLLAWYAWASRPVPGGPLATVTTPTPGAATPTPAFTLPPPDSVPPAAAGVGDGAVPDPTTPVDPGASAADPDLDPACRRRAPPRRPCPLPRAPPHRLRPQPPFRLPRPRPPPHPPRARRQAVRPRRAAAARLRCSARPRPTRPTPAAAAPTGACAARRRAAPTPAPSCAPPAEAAEPPRPPPPRPRLLRPPWHPCRTSPCPRVARPRLPRRPRSA